VKRVGKICIGLVGGLALCAGLRAGNLSADNPYAPIVARNVFDIHPPPPDRSKEKEAEQQMPKITLNGIISTFGRLQALYKVAVPGRPGVPAKDESYILGEGEAQDDIGVVKIDEKGGMVTFNNHGMDQDVQLADAGGGSGPAPGGGAPTAPPFPRPNFPGFPGFPRPGFTPPAASSSGFIKFGSQSGGPGQNLSGNSPTASANPSSHLGVAMGGAGYTGPQQEPVQLSGDDQSIIVAARHAVALQNGDPTAQIYPPTEHDAEAGIPTPGGAPQP